MIHFFNAGLWFINALMWAFNAHNVFMTCVCILGVLISVFLGRDLSKIYIWRGK